MLATMIKHVVACAAALSCGGAWAQAQTELLAAQTIVVTATRHGILSTDAPAALSVVTQRDIEARGADNVFEAIRGETGLSLQGRAVGGRKVLSVRGMDSRQALFLVDGRRIGASDGVIGASDFQYDWIAVEDIERIEIVRGPMSVLYGSEAMGGVVNVITRQPGDRWHFGATAEGSDADGGRGGGGWRVAARADGPLGPDLSLRAGIAASQVDAVASLVDPLISELEARHKRDAWLGLGWRPAAGQRIDVEHRQGAEEREANARERGGRRRYHVTTNDIDRSMTSLGWDAQWGASGEQGPLETQVRTYRSTIDVENRRTQGVTVNVPQRVEEQVLEAQAYRPFTTHALTAGWEARNEALADPGLPGGRSLLRHRSIFAQDEWQVAKPLALTLGLRRDTHEQYGHEWSPRAYAVWRIGDGWTAKGGYSHGFKVPNLKQVVPGARPEGPNTFLGNPDLKPERSDALEFGVGLEAGQMQAQAMAFDQRVEDLIEVRLVAPGAVPGIGTYTYENTAKARLRGFEGSLSRPLGAGFSTALNYTYLDATAGSGQRLERRPRHSATARVDWRGGVWRTGVYIEHAGDQLLPSTTVGAPAQRAPDVTLLGAHVTCELESGLEASFGVQNLTNVVLSEKSPLFTHAEAPRTWRLTLRGRW
jgi:outer membrane receptor for ferrienterochelin and colicins